MGQVDLKDVTGPDVFNNALDGGLVALRRESTGQFRRDRGGMLRCQLLAGEGICYDGRGRWDVWLRRVADSLFGGPQSFCCPVMSTIPGGLGKTR